MSLARINILTANAHSNAWAFNCPLLAARSACRTHGMDLRFFFREKPGLFDGDILLVNSSFFRFTWKNDKGRIFKCLETAASGGMKVFWNDLTDSTWSPHFEVLPIVTGFLKNQVLVDRTRYLEPSKTGRISIDFFDKLYNSGEKESQYRAPLAEELPKINVSWNTSLENYGRTRYSLMNKLKRKFRPWLHQWLEEKLEPSFIAPGRPRPVDLSCRVGCRQSRPAVVAHRKAILALLEGRGIPSGPLPRADYFDELERSKVGISPFGMGELCYRDYETMLAGAALLKPDMGHLETWPSLFIPGETYCPHKWDLSDFEEKLDALLADDELREKLACAAQRVYREALPKDVFAARLAKLLKVS
ncbi:MAG: hypothetical protein A2X49_05540 [Lentisphaerae bacterium GWF2_52_8]|nr:MAG: hypothetical protein A2X49_05540 [Lentisphaerae bacterium GWF2_52_8]